MRRVVVLLLCVLLVATLVRAPPLVSPLGAYSTSSQVSTGTGCENLKIGIVGASNTIRAGYRKNFDQLLSERCSGAEMFLYAEGGKGPLGLKPKLTALLNDNPNLDIVILDPSVNENHGDVATYNANVLALVEMIKGKNQNTKVVILTNTPAKGYEDWTEQLQSNIDVFNANLLSTRLGSNQVDFVVDTYSHLEVPPSSDVCGYCVGDKIHLNTQGEEIVVDSVMNTVFNKAVASGLSVPSSSITNEKCKDPQRCREIDEVWQKLTNWLAKAKKGQVWDTIRGDWTSFSEKYLKVVELKPPVPVPVPVPAVPVKPGICAANYGTPEQRALLDTIAWAEGANNKYNIMFGGSEFKSYAAHPVETGEMSKNGITANGISSTAAGRYQYVYNSYLPLKQNGFFTNFEPAEQDRAALHDITTRGGVTEEILANAISTGVFTPVWDRLARIWASLPYSKSCPSDIIEQFSKYSWFDQAKCGNGKSIYSQGGRSYESLKATYLSCLQFHKGGSGGFPVSIAGSVLSQTGNFLGSIFGSEESAPQTQQGNAVSFKNSVLEQACTAESLVCVIPPQNIGKQEAPGIGKCRPGMVQIGNICIDQYEAMLVKKTGEVWSPYCNPGDEIANLGAVSIAGVVPQSTISQLQAKQACQNAGKKLCTNEEWVSICQGNEKRTYPYATDHQDAACNDEFPSRGMHVVKETVEVDFCPSYQPFYDKQGLDATGKKITFNTAPWMQHPKNNQQENSLDPTGNNVQCKTPEGVYDLVGNLAEWTADPDGTFRGGYYQLTQGSSGNSGCLYRTTAHGPSYSDYSLGFRCCATLN